MDERRCMRVSPGEPENELVSMLHSPPRRVRVFPMKIAAYIHQDAPGVGLVSADLKELRPLDLPARLRVLGALPVVEALARGEPLPGARPGVAALIRCGSRRRCRGRGAISSA